MNGGVEVASANSCAAGSRTTAVVSCVDIVTPLSFVGWASGEPLDELECGGGDLPPAAVDRQGVAAIRDLHDLGDAGVALLPFEGGVHDRPGDGVVGLARDQQQRSALRVLGVDLCLGP